MTSDRGRSERFSLTALGGRRLAEASEAFAPMLDHAVTEQHLSTLELAFTSLRSGFYAATVPRPLGRDRDR